jgi:hypothetical protein
MSRLSITEDAMNVGSPPRFLIVVSLVAVLLSIAPRTLADRQSLDDLQTRVLSATVRINVTEGTGTECGSGTIIDRRGSAALILTCAHVFESGGGKGRIQVTLFRLGAGSNLPGQLLAMDLERDVALVRVENVGEVTPIRLAEKGHSVRVGDEMVVAGCDLGGKPSARQTKVTALNRFYGRANVEVAAVPREGRSGGSLVTADARVVGVCHGINPVENEGIYNGVAAVYQLAAMDDWARSKPHSAMPAGSNSPEPITAKAVAKAATKRPPAATSEQPASARASSASVTNDLEVICIVRPKGDPAATSKVLVLKDPSARFLRALDAEESIER